jgi:glutathione synthase/RimK-type ligase-like ATP-grasp enzyme
MTKILILSSKIKKRKKSLITLIAKNFKKSDTGIVIKRVKSLSIFAETGKVELFIGADRVSNFDLVYFRGVSLRDFKRVESAAICMQAQKVKFFDSVYANPGSGKTKFSSLLLLVANNISVPKSIYFADGRYVYHFNKIAKYLGTPFVAKEMSMQKGKGVYLIENVDDLKNIPMVDQKGRSNEYFFQKVIDKDHEYRLLTLGNKVGVWEEKIAQTAGEFRNNVALGAKEIFFDLKVLIRIWKKFA